MDTLKDLATNPEHTSWMYPLLVFADAALCGLIVEKIPCKPFPPSYLPLLIHQFPLFQLPPAFPNR